MSNDVEKGKAGQFFEDFLKEQGTFEETNERAAKRVLAFQLAGETKRQCTAEANTARRLDTGRSEIDRHPDPKKLTVSMAALARAESAVARRPAAMWDLMNSAGNIGQLVSIYRLTRMESWVELNRRQSRLPVCRSCL